ncbi:GH92 family glycosyl hydrolase [Coprobacter secundus]|uniref:GH92 family glycosyl hydrolase n=1 Tax=Coprobacter secundus TaxID=1501392 RepID=UPI0023F9C152|nr:GH92 family glycosyl hydrolase [Coprobacter secundus]
MKFEKLVISCAVSVSIMWFSCSPIKNQKITPVDYVNPYIGNISHMLVPTYPTVHLPNSMMRVCPQRDDFTGNVLHGLPVFLSGHRGYNVFNISPYQGKENIYTHIVDYEYDNEIIKPYYYSVYLDNIATEIQFVPSNQSALYEMDFKGTDTPYLIINTYGGILRAIENVVSGWQYIKGSKTKVYLYLEIEQNSKEIIPLGIPEEEGSAVLSGENRSIVFKFAPDQRKVKVRYGISFISEEQAKRNVDREIKSYDINVLLKEGRNTWNRALGKILVQSDLEEDKQVFYTSLYRFYERMICISEDGKYYSGFDGKVHNDEGIPFYNDDWIWDTYRAAHPLRVIIDSEKESHMINSFVRMSEQMENCWMPTFPEVVGDTRRMNCNHGVATIIDCYEKGIRNFDLSKAYKACKGAITEKTLSPWSKAKAGKLDEFYKEKGYFPALSSGEKETASEVDSWEKRQPVAVTLGTVYDEWCLAKIAQKLGYNNDYEYFIKRSLNYRKVFNTQTRFFHPKDDKGEFVRPFDYSFSGGLGAREAYDENNGWIYRWDVSHNVKDLIKLMGGNKAFVQELERMYSTSLGRPKYEFYAMLPDHTGNVGQFSMGNEPSLHVPYLYNYAGEPWRTQKRIRTLLNQWFRPDVMGVPGDEDGGGMSAFVVFSQLGFYPVTPGLPMYVIGSPTFERASICLDNGKTFEIICHNYAPENKYIQSVKLNGKSWEKSWFSHDELMQGGILEFTMGKYPNKNWAAAESAFPPSFEMK